MRESVSREDLTVRIVDLLVRSGTEGLTPTDLASLLEVRLEQLPRLLRPALRSNAIRRVGPNGAVRYVAV
jgi:hypothetical protein